MLKNILNLKGAQQLSKKEQHSIHGGLASFACGCLTLSFGDPCHYVGPTGCNMRGDCAYNPFFELVCLDPPLS